MAGPVAEELRRHGVALRLGQSVAAITERDVALSSGEVVPADLVIVAIGMRPDTALARDAGLEVGERGGIKVDRYNRTSDPRVYAVGDAAEKIDSLDGYPTLVPWPTSPTGTGASRPITSPVARCAPARASAPSSSRSST